MFANQKVLLAIFCLLTGILANDPKSTSIFTTRVTRASNDTTSESEVNQGNSKEEGREGRIIENDKNLQNSINTADNTIQTGKPHELDTWEAPITMQKHFIYYHAGFDEEGRPIWSWELGKWNFRSVTDAGPETVKTFDKYMDQLVHRIIKSLEEKSTPDDPVTTAIAIIDMEDFNLIQMAHIPTVQLIIRTVAKFRPIIDEYMHVGMAVNTNAAAQGLITLLRPVLGHIMERVEIYGTNKQSWIPRLLKHVPRDQIPEWYGGVKNFKPQKVYG